MRYIISILLTCAPALAGAQVNLVLNPSFEQHLRCPYNFGEVTNCDSWMTLDSTWTYMADSLATPLSSPTYCNLCGTDVNTSVPDNGFFYHYCRTGAGMMCSAMYHDCYTPDTNGSRDYLQGHLAHTLTGGHSYIVTFYVVNSNQSTYAINDIGAYLDNGAIDTVSVPGAPHSGFTMQVIDTGLISDTLNWTKIQGIFTANGTERLITIGNFADCSDTHAVPLFDTTGLWAVVVGGGGGRGGAGAGSDGVAIFNVDDVSVIDCSTQPFAGDDTTIHVGDSVYLGSTEILIPWEWYVRGDTTPIATGAGVWVTPTVTTTYVVKNNICGLAQGAIWDTVVVTVDTGSTDTTHHVNGVVTIPSPTANGYSLFPNPNDGNFIVKQMVADNAPVTITIRDVLGKRLYKQDMQFNNSMLQIQTGNIAPGIYLLQIADNTGKVLNFKFVIQ